VRLLFYFSLPAYIFSDFSVEFWPPSASFFMTTHLFLISCKYDMNYISLFKSSPLLFESSLQLPVIYIHKFGSGWHWNDVRSNALNAFYHNHLVPFFSQWKSNSFYFYSLALPHYHQIFITHLSFLIHILDFLIYIIFQIWRFSPNKSHPLC
jgi:hypothetical protein